MMSPEAVRSMERKMAKEAAYERREPYIVFPEDVSEIAVLRMIPVLGTYVPEGWAKVNEHFVDSSGWGQEDEPALTAQCFADMLVPGHGYGIVSAGQFQVYVGEYVQE